MTQNRLYPLALDALPGSTIGTRWSALKTFLAAWTTSRRMHEAKQLLCIHSDPRIHLVALVALKHVGENKFRKLPAQDNDTLVDASRCLGAFPCLTDDDGTVYAFTFMDLLP